MSFDPARTDELINEFCNVTNESSSQLLEISTYYSPYFKLRFGPITPQYIGAVCLSFPYSRRPETILRETLRCVGFSFLGGLAIGGIYGMFKERRSKLAGEQVVDLSLARHNIIKHSLLLASTCGSIALIHQTLEKSISGFRDKKDDYNFIIAGLGTGLLYNAGSGWRKCVRSGAIGLGLTSTWCLGEFLSDLWKTRQE